MVSLVRVFLNKVIYIYLFISAYKARRTQSFAQTGETIKNTSSNLRIRPLGGLCRQAQFGKPFRHFTVKQRVKFFASAQPFATEKIIDFQKKRLLRIFFSHG